MNQLQLRKKLLLAESELNRAQMVAEATALAVNVRGLARRAGSFGLLAASARVLVTGLGLIDGGRPAEDGEKHSWLRKGLKGAGVVSSLWFALRMRGHKKSPVG